MPGGTIYTVSLEMGRPYKDKESGSSHRRRLGIDGSGRKSHGRPEDGWHTLDLGIQLLRSARERIERLGRAFHSIPITGAGNGWASVAAGNAHTIGVKTDGTIYVWGENIYGQVGDGGGSNRLTPFPTSIDGKWIAPAVGSQADHTVVVKADGMVWAWGNNSDGQLGDGTSSHRNIPVKIVWRGNKWASLAGGMGHTAGVKSDGTLWAWGSNDSGQIGDRSYQVNKYLPMKIGDNRWLSLEAGSYHTVGIKSDGSLWAWGYNTYGQLGDGTSGNVKTEPISIASGTAWKRVDAGIYHTLAVKSDGTLWGWGYNSDGELGDGTNTERHTPTSIAAGATWKGVASGIYHTVGIKSDGTLWSWGKNVNGQLGDEQLQVKTYQQWS